LREISRIVFEEPSEGVLDFLQRDCSSHTQILMTEEIMHVFGPAYHLRVLVDRMSQTFVVQSL